MNVRDLERLLAAHGISTSKLDGVTRRLREAGRLPIGGRGTNAPTIGADEAASIIIAVAGSGKAIEADVRLAKLEMLKTEAGRTFHSAVRSYLEVPSTLEAVAQVTVSRTTRHAAIFLQDGTAERFSADNGKARRDRFLVEATIPGPLLRRVADELSGHAAAASRSGKYGSEGDT